ncbi:MAG TPA: plastocyanin/azurin family copper-binding protein [Candidatus Krumholzibacteria bacterium]|nr:plastocyanin/azurin family copper-binding protein [Candidatus Krumholzibacteria bacterium]
MIRNLRSLSRLPHIVSAVAFGAAVFLMIPSCGDDEDPVDPGNGSPLTVRVLATSFSPQNLTIQANQTVTWTFNGGPHTVTEGTAVGNPPSPLFDSGQRSSGSFAFTFDTPGTYNYICEIHVGMGMTGTITVEP